MKVVMSTKTLPQKHKIGNNSPKQLAPDLLEMPERKLRKILRKRQVMALLGIGHSALADAVARGDLPKPINITERGRIVGWFEDELVEHLEKRAQERGDVYHSAGHAE